MKRNQDTRARSVSPRGGLPGGTWRRALAVAALLCVGASAWAGRVVLKNGRVVEGQILEETDAYVKIQVAGSAATVKLAKSMLSEVSREEGMTPEEAEGDQLAFRREYAAARERYRAAREKAGEEAARKRLDEKVAGVTRSIVEVNQSILDQVYERALDLAKRKRFEEMDESKEMIRQAMAEPLEGVTAEDVDEAIAMLYFNKAQSHMDRLQYEQAAASIAEAIDLAPGISRLYLMRAELIHRRGGQNQSESIADYVKGLELADDTISKAERARYHFRVGQLMRKEGRLSEAIDHLLAAADLQPNEYKEGISAAAEAYLTIIEQEGNLLKNVDEKVKRLRSLIALSPYSPQATSMRELIANLLNMQKRYEEAIEVLQEILKYEPALPEIHYRIALAWRDMANAQEDREKRAALIDKAREAFEAELAVNPNNYEAYCDVAEIYYDRLRLEQAHETLTTAIELEPAKWRAYRLIMRTEKRLGEMGEEVYYDRAMIHADELIAMRGEPQPEYYEAMMLKGDILTDQGKYDLALDQIEAVRAALGSRNVESLTDIERSALSSAHGNRGVIALERDDEVHMAEQQYIKAIAVDPDNVDAHYNLAEVNKRLAPREPDLEGKNRRYRKAESEYKIAIELDPHNPERYLHLGTLYYRFLKEPEKALDQFRQYKERGGESEAVEKIVRDIERLIR